MNKPLLTGCFLVLLLGFTMQPRPVSADDITSPTTKGGKYLADLLQPGRKVPALDGPRLFPQPPSLETVNAPLGYFRGLPPRSFLTAQGKPLQPRSLREGLPLASQHGEPRLPEVLVLPAGELVRLPATDVQTPVPLPFLAQPQRDRAPLTDPTMAASLAAVLGELAPARLAPVPFAPINLPDPFENSQVARVRNPPAEQAVPVVVTPHMPPK